jgi:DNA polymerase III subunit alpha
LVCHNDLIMKHTRFVHLHTHTQYSLLDGAIRIEDLCNKAAEYKMPAVAITDHGNLFGAVKFYQQARNKGVKPIIGCEVYVAPGDRRDKKPSAGPNYYHLVLLAKNKEGYINLCRMVTASHLEGFYYKPRIDKQLLRENNAGIIALSACLQGEVARTIRNGDYQGACRVAQEYAEIFDDRRFYLEIQENGIEEQTKVNEALIRIAADTGLPLVATNDCHYLTKDDYEAHELLLCIQTGKTIDEPDRMKMPTNEFYFKSPEEMIARFDYCPEAIANTVEIAERCNFSFEFGTFHFPIYKIPEGESLFGNMEKEARDGLKQRFAIYRERGVEIDADKEKGYWDRLEEELALIDKMGFSGYFLIVADFINYAKQKSIPVGPGRGSAAGSLVAYAMRITELDPLPYDLFFERFLNPGRISMPDIDVDFCMERRDEVISYVSEKYGGNQFVSQILTLGTLKAKQVIKDVGRALGMPYGDVDKIAKMIPEGPKVYLKDAIAQEKRLSDLIKSDEQVKRLIDVALRLEGLSRHSSKHAAGVIISDIPLENYMPLARNAGKEDEVTSQFDMKDVEKLGLVKFDFLGLKTLTVINHACNLVMQNRGDAIDLNAIPLDDAKTFQLLRNAETTGIFQLESSGMKDILIRLRPDTFEEIIDIVALYRPGPIKSGMVDLYIERKHGRQQITYDLPQLEPILKSAKGVILYQEQVMQIAKELANFTLGDGDLLRRAMGKKNPAEMDQQRDKFMKGALVNKIQSDKADKIFNDMAEFANYGFNKSHSAAYALISFQTAYLKAHYPAEFLAAQLSAEGDKDKIIRLLNECRDVGIPILPPDINESYTDFIVIDNSIRFGLGAIANVGVAAINEIVEKRKSGGKYKSLSQFCESIDLARVNKRVVESLIKSGAFDCTGAARDEMICEVESEMSAAAGVQRDRAAGQSNLFDMLGSKSSNKPKKKANFVKWTARQVLQYEKETLGYYMSGHPLDRHKGYIEDFCNYSSSKLKSCPDKSEVRMGGIVSGKKELITQKGGRMAFVSFEDLEGTIETIFFPKAYEKYRELLEDERPLLLRGKADVSSDQVKIIADEVFSLAEAAQRLASRARIVLKADLVDREIIKRVKEILGAYHGGLPVSISLLVNEAGEAIIELPQQYHIAPGSGVRGEFKKYLGYDALTYQ